MAAGEHGRAGEAYNLGTAGVTRVSIRELFDTIRMTTGVSRKSVEVIESHDPGDPNRWSNGEKAINELDWKAKTNLVEMLQRAVEWYNEQ